MKKKASEILEEDKTPHLEMPLVRKKGGKWKELPAKRTSSSVNFSSRVIAEETENQEYNFLHTHPRLEEDTKLDDPYNVLVDEGERDLVKNYPEIYKGYLENSISA